MSDLKMSDVFHGDVIHFGGRISDDRCDEFALAEFEDSQEAAYACHAINSYDSNQELIAKQAEQIKLLELSIKEAVAMIGEISYLQEESIILTLSARTSKAATAKG